MHTTTPSSLNRNTVSRIVVSTLKGISQVVLIENAMTGFVILIAILISSVSLAIISLLSALIGTVIGIGLRADTESVNRGLMGYNSVLTGMALTLFLTGGDRWIIALVGAAVAAIFSAAMNHIMKNTGLPSLTFPFIVLSWFFLLTSYRLTSFKISSALVPQDLTHWSLNIQGEINWLNGMMKGSGQIFFLDYSLSGILLYAAFFIAGWRYGLYAIIGNAAAIITAYFLGGEHSLISMGLYGYNAILTIIAVSIVFKEHQRYALLTGVIAACLTIPITASIDTWLLPYGLPALTMPFVLCSWLFLAARKMLPSL
ncbi:urea transporter [Paenibacillus terrigena]|uniref:urea transporter n=1 Tax=Paenibacillus terrigena TaxID=369333 RepID=UPI0028D48A52|nr:urea transporter [Paenibacillus terrigena]